MDYKMTCGIETHIELSTKTKIFCGCTTAFGGEPNSHCCPVCTGQPGALPVLNKKVVEFAVRAGLAVNCRINNKCHMDRKNYFYPDLPKAFQISQFDEPVCENGFIELDSGKKIRIKRIHIEEDAGKLIHEEESTYVDYNRSGVPLIEIVSEPDFETSEEAREYAEKLRLIMKYIAVSDCKMQEGSVRFDVNVSIHEEGMPLGIKTEIKNLGSISNMEKAINAEFIRQKKLLESGEKLVQATMSYDVLSDSVSIMRIKENADDYRYFPEPDMLRFVIKAEEIEKIKCGLPELPMAKYKRYTEKLGLSAESAGQLYKYKKASDFFDSVIAEGTSPSNTVNLMLKSIFSNMSTEEEKECFETLLSVNEVANLVKLVDDKKLRFNKAASILTDMNKTGKTLGEYINEEDLKEITENELERLCKEAIAANPKAAEDVRNGKHKAINVLFGYVMKHTGSRADIKKTEKILMEIL